MLSNPYTNFYISSLLSPKNEITMPPKAFKPPRPSTSSINKTTKPKSKTARTSTDSTSKSRSSTKAKDKRKVKQRGSNGFEVPPRVSGLPSLSPDTEPESGDDPFASDAQPYADPIEIDSDSQAEQEDERREAIPPELLMRLLHENFKEKGTRLSKDASNAVGRYMETFVREALARAAFARVEIEEREAGAGGGFLEVEDLEKLAPQLLLDF
jgi:hypothetical protein